MSHRSEAAEQRNMLQIPTGNHEYRRQRTSLKGYKEGPLEGTLNLIALYNPIYIYIYIFIYLFIYAPYT